VSAISPTRFRALSFGELDGRLWGGALWAGEPAVVFGIGDATVAAAGAEAVDWSLDGRGWRLRGDGFDLHMEPGGEELDHDPAPDPGQTVSGVEELCRVQGTLTIGSDTHRVDCVGVRWMLDGVDVTGLGSLRAVSGWVADDQALAVLALRPRAASTHGDDMIAATLFDPGGWVSVGDPRMSTTYTADGLPAIANLELWIGDGEEEYPRRAAVRATGPGAAAQTAPFGLRVAPMSCHARGHDGAGVYVLATFGQ
jgi:hypothetical protein